LRREAETQNVRAGFEAFYRDKWGGRDGFWLDWYPRHLGLYADLLRQRNRALAAAVPTGLERILDCGCGAGDVSALLHDHAREVISCDVAGSNTRQTHRNLMARFGGALVLRAGGEELPFADETFDAVVLADVIEHIPRADRAVAEFARVLRPGGRLVMATPDRAVLGTIERLDRVASSVVSSMRAAARRVIGRAYRPAPAGTEQWEQFFSRAELAKLVADAGLTVVEHRNICFYPGPEGGGTFALFLAYLAPFDRLRERVLEPTFRRVFGALARLEVMNQKQLIVAEK
jgi:ubiquinone/menaquinone biosynthesis C-methylase UbiE